MVTGSTVGVVLVPGGDYCGRCDGDSGGRGDSGSGGGWGREGSWGVGYLRQLAQAPADNLLHRPTTYTFFFLYFNSSVLDQRSKDPRHVNFNHE